MSPTPPAAAEAANIIYPQPGFQMAALSTPADIAIIGGGAGGGKTFVLLIEATRHRFNKNFQVVMFRRSYPQIMNAGGLWDASKKVFPLVRAVPRENQVDWKFPSGATVAFRHLQADKTVSEWQGTEIPLIIFDELTHFSSYQFFYMLSRNRSTSGVKPYVRASCNPDPDSWVAEFIAWWINPETGFPIPERAGVVRYFTRDGEITIWGDTPEEVRAKAPHLYEGLLADVQPKSATFIPGSVFENQKLLDIDPSYLGNLMALGPEEKAQLLEGNWKVKVDGLALFEPNRISDLFSNRLLPPPRPRRYITCDAAGFGKDYTVIMVWEGWKVVQIVVERKTDSRAIFDAVEAQRRKWQVAESDVLIDQDGVGGRVFTHAPNYKGFGGGATAMKDPITDEVERYVNLKTQCYCRMAERVNGNTVAVEVNDDTVSVDGVRGMKLMQGKQVTSVLELLKADLKAIKRGATDAEKRKTINSKEEQKILLTGRSPDFSDTFMMREWFELRHEVKPWFMKRRN